MMSVAHAAPSARPHLPPQARQLLPLLRRQRPRPPPRRTVRFDLLRERPPRLALGHDTLLPHFRAIGSLPNRGKFTLSGCPLPRRVPASVMKTPHPRSLHNHMGARGNRQGGFGLPASAWDEGYGRRRGRPKSCATLPVSGTGCAKDRLVAWSISSGCHAFDLLPEWRDTC